MAAHLTSRGRHTIDRLNAAADALPEPVFDIEESIDSKTDAANEKSYG